MAEPPCDPCVEGIHCQQCGCCDLWKLPPAVPTVPSAQQAAAPDEVYRSAAVALFDTIDGDDERVFEWRSCPDCPNGAPCACSGVPFPSAPVRAAVDVAYEAGRRSAEAESRARLNPSRHLDHIHPPAGVEQVGWLGHSGQVYALDDPPGADREPAAYLPLYQPRDEECGHQLRDEAADLYDDLVKATSRRIAARAAQARAEAERDAAVKLLDYALHLRQFGERAPGGSETWRQFDRDAEAFLRGLGGGEEGTG